MPPPCFAKKSPNPAFETEQNISWAVKSEDNACRFLCCFAVGAFPLVSQQTQRRDSLSVTWPNLPRDATMSLTVCRITERCPCGEKDEKKGKRPLRHERFTARARGEWMEECQKRKREKGEWGLVT
eukprot:1484058-Rhodomonas_salina.5